MDLLHELEWLEASRLELAAAFRNSLPSEGERLETLRAGFLAEVAAVRDEYGDELSDVQRERVAELERQAMRLEWSARPQHYRRVHRGGAPGLGKRA